LTIKTRGPNAFKNLILSLRQSNHEDVADILEKQNNASSNTKYVMIFSFSSHVCNIFSEIFIETLRLSRRRCYIEKKNMKKDLCQEMNEKQSILREMGRRSVYIGTHIKCSLYRVNEKNGSSHMKIKEAFI